MRVLLTGHTGYIGTVMAPMLARAGHEVIGLDTGLFEGNLLGRADALPAMRLDIRDVAQDDLAGFDAIVHLAGLSNDPLGDLNADLTFEINHRASVRLARLARAAGVERFVFASSCSLYGASGDEMVTETAAFNPVTAYGSSKIKVEQDVAPLATDDFSPVFLRNATAYGASPRLRGDLAVNNLAGFAFTTGRVEIMSDGSPWRPFVHVEDISLGVLCALEAPREAIHNQAFNIGRDDENYQIRDVAEMVREAVAGSTVQYASDASPDKRCYRVSFAKARDGLPGFRPTWSVKKGIEQLLESYHRHHLQFDDLIGPRFQRIRHIRQLLAEGQLQDDLRWMAGATAHPASVLV
ncbi:MAG: SDR family oxidoreductase [Chloroflexi bacterium]|nr:SDR family oxidoreductase [Chloroflexota bacterium]